MSNQISFEYRGYSITYSQNDDTWQCFDCGVRGQATLKKAKELIDAMHLKLRKAAALPCLEIAAAVSNSVLEVRATEGTIIEYIGPAGNRYGRPVDDHQVAVVAMRGGTTKKARRESSLSGLAHDTPEVHDKIAEADALGRIAHEAAQAFRAAVAAIPRIQIEDIDDLVKASGHTFQEGEQ